MSAFNPIPWALVVITNRNFDYFAQLPKNCFVVSPENFHNYYGHYIQNRELKF